MDNKKIFTKMRKSLMRESAQLALFAQQYEGNRVENQAMRLHY